MAAPRRRHLVRGQRRGRCRRRTLKLIEISHVVLGYENTWLKNSFIIHIIMKCVLNLLASEEEVDIFFPEADSESGSEGCNNDDCGTTEGDE